MHDWSMALPLIHHVKCLTPGCSATESLDLIAADNEFQICASLAASNVSKNKTDL